MGATYGVLSVSHNSLDLGYPPLNEHDVESMSEQFLLEDSEAQSHVLLEFLSSVSSKWYEIGGLLGVDDNTLDGLHATNDSPQVKLSKTLQNWLNNQPTPTTWRKIIKIVEGPLQKKSLLAIVIIQYLIKGGISPILRIFGKLKCFIFYALTF